MAYGCVNTDWMNSNVGGFNIYRYKFICYLSVLSIYKNNLYLQNCSCCICTKDFKIINYQSLW
jgi:hypothetical protein